MCRVSATHAMTLLTFFTTALFLTLTKAAPIPRTTTTKPTFGATCWGEGILGTHAPGCSVYVPSSSPALPGFTEYTMNRTSGAWSHSSITLTSIHSTTLPPPRADSPITVLSTHDFGLGPASTSIFYAHHDSAARAWRLMQLERVGGAPTWGRWTDGRVAPTYPMTRWGAAVVHMTSVVWVEDGRPAYSVWWNDANGSVYRWRRDPTGRWTDDGVVPGVHIRSPHFKVTYDADAEGTVDIVTTSSHWRSSPYTPDAWIPVDLSDQSQEEGEEWEVPLSKGTLPWFFNHVFNCFFFFYVVFSKWMDACLLWGGGGSPRRIMGAASWADPRLLPTHVYGIGGESYMTVFMLNARNQITSAMWQSGRGWASPVVVASLSASSRALNIQGIYAA